MNIYFPDGKGGKQLLETGSNYELPTATPEIKGGIKVGENLKMIGDSLNAVVPKNYELPTATADIKGGIKVGENLKMIGDSLNAVVPENYKLPVASADSLGGVKIGDEFQLVNEKLYLAGPVKSSLTFNEGFYMPGGNKATFGAEEDSHSPLLFYHNAKIFLNDSTLQGTASLTANVDLPNVNVKLGNAEQPAKIQMINSSVRADNATVKVATGSVFFDGKVKFNNVVSLRGGDVKTGLDIDDQSQIFIGEQATVTLGTGTVFDFAPNCSINAKSDSINVTNATIVGGSATSITGDLNFTGTPSFKSGLNAQGTVDFRDATVKGISTGLTNPYDGEITITGGSGNGGSINAFGYDEGGAILLGSYKKGGTVNLDAAYINAEATGGTISACGYKGGTLNLKGSSTNGTGGTINLTGATGGVIDLSSASGKGGTISLVGAQGGGTIDLHGFKAVASANGGTINLSGYGGGTIDLSATGGIGASPGQIKGTKIKFYNEHDDQITLTAQDALTLTASSYYSSVNAQSNLINFDVDTVKVRNISFGDDVSFDLQGHTVNIQHNGSTFNGFYFADRVTLDGGISFSENSDVLSAMSIENGKLKIIINNQVYYFTPDA